MRVVLAAAAAAALTACTTYDQGYDRYRYEGSAWNTRHGGGGLRGPGVDLLDPWLAETGEGQALVRSGWRRARRGHVDEEVAVRANRWFRRYADADRDYCLTDEEIRHALVWATRRMRMARR